MFEKFTEKALNVVSEAQAIAQEMNSEYILSEHLLLALAKEARGVSLKIFKMYNISYETLRDEIVKNLDITQKTTSGTPNFSMHVKNLLKNTLDLANRSGNQSILYEHLFLAVINDRNSNNVKTLEKLGFNVFAARTLLEKHVQRKTKRLSHPENEETKEQEQKPADATDAIFDSKESANVFERAVAKLSASNYEILGTEQIISSILEDKDSELTKILEANGVTLERFDEKLEKIQSRQAEYEGRQIILTPNLFTTMNMALQTAKERGPSVALPEHIVLGILKTKKGLAYEIFKELKIVDDDLAHSIIKPIEKEMPQTLTILRLAKEEARRLGRNVVGTEMFLLGIIGEGAGVGAQVLSELAINIRDARKTVENIIGFGNEYYDKEIVFTPRAKRVLEKAWEFAKRKHKSRIESSDMLLALTTEPDCLAMKALEYLGVDAVEIKEGIKKFDNV